MDGKFRLQNDLIFFKRGIKLWPTSQKDAYSACCCVRLSNCLVTLENCEHLINSRKRIFVTCFFENRLKHRGSYMSAPLVADIADLT